MSTRWLSAIIVLSVTVCGCGSSTGTNQGQQQPTTTIPQAAPAAQRLTRSAVIAARKKYLATVVSFDASQEFGTEFPYSDLVRVRITNGSEIALPALTLLTKRFDASGKMIGSSRAPAVPVRDLSPGETAEIDFFPRGHLPGVRRITVETEALISPDSEKFFEELKGVAPG